MLPVPLLLTLTPIHKFTLAPALTLTVAPTLKLTLTSQVQTFIEAWMLVVPMAMSFVRMYAIQNPTLLCPNPNTPHLLVLFMDLSFGRIYAIRIPKL